MGKIFIPSYFHLSYRIFSQLISFACLNRSSNIMLLIERLSRAWCSSVLMLPTVRRVVILRDVGLDYHALYSSLVRLWRHHVFIDLRLVVFVIFLVCIAMALGSPSLIEGFLGSRERWPIKFFWFEEAVLYLALVEGILDLPLSLLKLIFDILRFLFWSLRSFQDFFLWGIIWFLLLRTSAQCLLRALFVSKWSR